MFMLFGIAEFVDIYTNMILGFLKKYLNIILKANLIINVIYI